MTRVTVVLVVDSSLESEAVPGSSSVVSGSEGSPSSVADPVVEVAGSWSVGVGLSCSPAVSVGDVVEGDVVVGSWVVAVGEGDVVVG